MRRLFPIFLIGLLFYCTSPFAQFSNLIVFGDSLSDVGNFPESSQIWWNPHAPKVLSNTVAQFYVPFSNPVNTKTNNPYLAKQARIENSKIPRRYRSMNWVQYFLMSAKNKKLIASDFVAPSNLLNINKIPHTISFNYAWGYAASSRNCVNPYYQPIKSCNANSIFQARKNYERDPSKENYVKIEIPGLFQQIQLFMQDNRSHTVSVNENTIYIFWTGGNDLIIANNALKNHANPLPILQFMLGKTAAHEIKNISRLIQFLPINLRPKKVYVFELFNPALTPPFYRTTIGSAGNFFVHCSNFWLSLESKLFNLFSNTKIVVVPSYAWFQQSANSDAFKSQLGKTCQLNGGDYTNPTSIPKSDCAEFLFWNAVHPSTKMNKIIAKRFLEIVQYTNQK